MEDPVYDGVEFEERACDLITINTQIDTFPTQTTAADECFKLEITYDVINWCEYNSIGQAYLIPRDKEDGRRDVEQDELYLHVRPGEDSFDNLGDDDCVVEPVQRRRFCRSLPMIPASRSTTSSWTTATTWTATMTTTAMTTSTSLSTPRTTAVASSATYSS
jgi:hypothetical protein